MFSIPSYISQINAKKPVPELPLENREFTKLVTRMLDYNQSTRATITEVCEILEQLKGNAPQV